MISAMGDTGFLAGAKDWLYGGEGVDTCARCGFDWSTRPQDALSPIARAPARYEALLEGRDGMAPIADGWNATSYVWHLADLARSWSERWVLIAAEPGSLVAGWDPDELAAARNYRNMPTISALWALNSSVSAFVELSRSLDPETRFRHGDWGIGTVGEALVWLAHELDHHEIDVDERAGQRA